MAKIKVLAGDFKKTSGSYLLGSLSLTPADSVWAWPQGYNIKSQVVMLEEADERRGVKVFGTALWGTVGAVLAGPAGLIVGGLLGGRGERVVFIAEFADGKKVMAEVDKKTWIKMKAPRM